MFRMLAALALTLLVLVPRPSAAAAAQYRGIKFEVVAGCRIYWITLADAHFMAARNQPRYQNLNYVRTMAQLHPEAEWYGNFGIFPWNEIVGVAGETTLLSAPTMRPGRYVYAMDCGETIHMDVFQLRQDDVRIVGNPARDTDSVRLFRRP